MIISPSNAQSLSSHQWKDRLVVIYSNATSNSTFQNQLNELKKESEGIRDRKIVIYQSINGKVKKGLVGNENWDNSEIEFQKLNDSPSKFEVLLIGLDGGVKLRKTDLLTTEELFGTIDQMPMRISEMRRKKDN